MSGGATVVTLDAATQDLLKRLAAHLAERQEKDAKALARRLQGAVKKGHVARGDFTVADVNTIQHSINTEEFMAKVLREIAEEPPSHATQGADLEAARAEAQAKRLKKYQEVVTKLIVGP